MYGKIKEFLNKELSKLKAAGSAQAEKIIASPQGAAIIVDGKKYLNFSSNNYLGLADHPEIIKAADDMIDRRGFGLASVRFISGTQDIHLELERKLSDFLGKEDTLLFSSCFAANTAVLATLLGADDVIISDALNHASIIDGIRLSKADKLIYNHSDMEDQEGIDPFTGQPGQGLARCLQAAQKYRFRLIVTDGVFSMEGEAAQLEQICNLAEANDALVMIDDSHATGIVGPHGRGTHELKNVLNKVDLVTTTFGKALGGAMGGCVSGPQEIINWLRSKARPYLFSNSLPPAAVGATMKALDMVSDDLLRTKLAANTKYFRDRLTAAGFRIVPGDHPIVPVLFHQYPNGSQLVRQFTAEVLAEGIYVIAFAFPIVPLGHDRIRVQISAAHEQTHLDQAIEAFVKVGKSLGLI